MCTNSSDGIENSFSVPPTSHSHVLMWWDPGWTGFRNETAWEDRRISNCSSLQISCMLLLWSPVFYFIILHFLQTEKSSTGSEMLCDVLGPSSADCSQILFVSKLVCPLLSLSLTLRKALRIPIFHLLHSLTIFLPGRCALVKQKLVSSVHGWLMKFSSLCCSGDGAKWSNGTDQPQNPRNNSTGSWACARTFADPR